MDNVIDFMSYKRVHEAAKELEELRVDNGFTKEEIGALLDLCYSMQYDPEQAEYDYQQSVYGVDSFDDLDRIGFTLTVVDDD